MNFGSPTDIGLSAVSLDMLTTESRRGGMRSLIRSNFLASSKLPILSLNCSRAKSVCIGGGGGGGGAQRERERRNKIKRAVIIINIDVHVYTHKHHINTFI